MQVGDIVELSAYGKRLKCNREFRDKVGLVVDVDPIAGLADHSNAIMVAWNGGDVSKPNYHIRRDLKHAK